MRRARSGLTYTNVVATLALFLTLSGGAVYAAGKVTSKQLGKGAVKNKNLAKNAVKNKNLAKNAVTSPKLAKNAVKNANVADGAINFAKLAAGTNVIASASTGSIPASQNGPVAFNPPLTVTPVAGQPLMVHFESRGALAGSGMEPCEVIPFPVMNGSPMAAGELLLLISPGALPEPFGTAGVSSSGILVPIGLTQPGVPQSVTAFVVSAGACTPDSTLQISAVVTQAK
jgi:hypothetical protein